MNFETIVNDQKIVISDSKKAKQQDAVCNELKKTLTQETEKKLKNLDAKQIELSKKLQDLKLLINDVKRKMVVSIADNYLVEISKNLKK